MVLLVKMNYFKVIFYIYKYKAYLKIYKGDKLAAETVVEELFP